MWGQSPARSYQSAKALLKDLALLRARMTFPLNGIISAVVFGVVLSIVIYCVVKEEVESAVKGDAAFEEREWQAAAMEEALRRMKPDVRPEHYAVFVASAVEGQDTEAVMKLYGLSRDNLYQIRTRLTEKLRETVAVVLAEMDSPIISR